MKIGERAWRLFALFALPTGPIACYVLKEEVLQSVGAFMEEEKTEFFFYNVNERNYVYRAQIKNWEKTWRNLSELWQQVLYMKGPTLWQPFKRKISFPFVFVCLFVCFYLTSAFLVFSLKFSLIVFCYPHFFLSSFFHPQVCGTRFTDTPWLDGITLIGKTTTTTISTWLDKNKKKWNA